MRLKVFSVFDSKAAAYLPPFFQATAGMAARVFQDACHDEKHQFNRHAGDYTLFQIGEYDDETGKLVALDKFINLGMASEVLAKSANDKVTE